jgi:hypothetical protein
MFSIFKKRTEPPSEDTFKHRVERFWDWYSQVAERFYQTIEKKQSTTLAPEVSNKVDELGPGFAWVFGPGKETGHSFTLSGEGVLHRQLLAQYWLTRAPKLAGWTYYDARQPGSINGIKMEIGKLNFDPIEFWITPYVNDDEEKIDITAWHPLFDQMSEKDRMMPLFLFLDEVLGEHGTEQWIGEIKLTDKKLADAIPLKELRGFVSNLQQSKDWKKYAPGEAATLYKCRGPHLRFRRGDTIIGTSRHAGLVNEYLRCEGQLADPLAGTGADYVFVSFDVKFLPQGRQVDVRGKIEDALDGALREVNSGRLLGGALGARFGYVDLLLYDGASSIEIVRRVLKQQNLPSGTTINFFAKEKRDQAVVVA